jgi:hypothetical protein
LTRKNAPAATSIAGSWWLANGCRTSSRGETSMARIAAQAAIIDSVYWPTLKRRRHAGFPERMSPSIEATP